MLHGYDKVVLAANTGTLTLTREPPGIGVRRGNAPNAVPAERITLTEYQKQTLLATLWDWAETNRLFVIEGIDGSGKNTVAERLAERMGAKVLAFPANDSTTGPAIRQYLRGEQTEACGPLGFQALQTVNRLEHLDDLIDPEDPLVLVRYWQSCVVYGQLDGLDPRFLTHIHRILPRARCNVLLDLPTGDALERMGTRDQREIYEQAPKMERVTHLYHDLWGAHDLPGWRVVDATQPVDTIVNQLADLWGQKPLC